MKVGIAFNTSVLGVKVIVPVPTPLAEVVVKSVKFYVL